MKIPSHRNCTYILPGKSFAGSPFKWMQERTHGCWCSSWKLMADDSWRIWRKGRWLRPKSGEVRMTEREEL